MEFHDCPEAAQDPPDVDADWRVTCGVCGAKWIWMKPGEWGYDSTRTERYGFLGLRKREVSTTRPNGWWMCEGRTYRMVDESGNATAWSKGAEL